MLRPLSSRARYTTKTSAELESARLPSTARTANRGDSERSVGAGKRSTTKHTDTATERKLTSIDTSEQHERHEQTDEFTSNAGWHRRRCDNEAQRVTSTENTRDQDTRRDTLTKEQDHL